MTSPYHADRAHFNPAQPPAASPPPGPPPPHSRKLLKWGLVTAGIAGIAGIIAILIPHHPPTQPPTAPSLPVATTPARPTPRPPATHETPLPEPPSQPPAPTTPAAVPSKPTVVNVPVDPWKKGPNDCLEHVLRNQGYSLHEIYSRDAHHHTLLQRVAQSNHVKNPHLVYPKQIIQVPVK